MPFIYAVLDRAPQMLVSTNVEGKSTPYLPEGSVTPALRPTVRIRIRSQMPAFGILIRQQIF
jgi:hypothetical protein